MICVLLQFLLNFAHLAKYSCTSNIYILMNATAVTLVPGNRTNYICYTLLCRVYFTSRVIFITLNWWEFICMYYCSLFCWVFQVWHAELVKKPQTPNPELLEAAYKYVQLYQSGKWRAWICLSLSFLKEFCKLKPPIFKFWLHLMLTN